MTNSEAAIPVALLHEFLSLDIPTGRLTWKARKPEHFQASEARSAAHICANWNAQNAGTPALECVDASGHLTGRIRARLLYAHRVVYAMASGAWPKQSIDHINGDPADNRPENLRDVSHRENHLNTKLFSNTTSGAVGVSFNKRLGKWAAHITVKGKYHHLGFHVEKGNAVSARKQAEAQFGFHQNHGRSTHASHS